MRTATLIVPVDNELHLQTENGQVVVSSRVVAERFEKRHNDVVRAIENKIESLTTQNCTVKNLFIESMFNHNGNPYKEYLLTRDGFTFIVMGFTGKEADKWKLKYIEAFNKMERALKEKRSKPNAPTLMELIQFIQLTREQMKEQGCSPREIAKVTQEICNQYGIQLPKYFIKPEETTLKEVYEMIDYICDQPRGRGIRRPNYEDFIAHQINMRLIP